MGCAVCRVYTYAQVCACKTDRQQCGMCIRPFMNDRRGELARVGCRVQCACNSVVCVWPLSNGTPARIGGERCRIVLHTLCGVSHKATTILCVWCCGTIVMYGYTDWNNVYECVCAVLRELLCCCCAFRRTIRVRVVNKSPCPESRSRNVHCYLRWRLFAIFQPQFNGRSLLQAYPSLWKYVGIHINGWKIFWQKYSIIY